MKDLCDRRDEDFSCNGYRQISFLSPPFLLQPKSIPCAAREGASRPPGRLMSERHQRSCLEMSLLLPEHSVQSQHFAPSLPAPANHPRYPARLRLYCPRTDDGDHRSPSVLRNMSCEAEPASDSPAQSICPCPSRHTWGDTCGVSGRGFPLENGGMLSPPAEPRPSYW